MFNVGADTPVHREPSSPRSIARRWAYPTTRSSITPARNEVKTPTPTTPRPQSVFGDAEVDLARRGRRANGALGEGARAPLSHSFEDIEIMKNLPPAWRTA